MSPQDPMRQLEQSLAELHQLTAKLKVVSQPGEGHDPAGVVTAALDAEQRLTAITVAAKWQEKVEPDALAQAVQAAISDGMVQSFGGADQPEVAESGEPEITPAIRDEAQEMVAERTRYFDAAVASGDQDALLAQFNQAMAQFDRIAADLERRANEGARVEYFNNSRRASIVYESGFPVEVRLDRNWVRGLSGNTITTAFAEILEQAAEQRHQLSNFGQ